METIEEFNPFAKKKEMRGTGFLFEESSVKSMMVAVRAALKTFRCVKWSCFYQNCIQTVYGYQAGS